MYGAPSQDGTFTTVPKPMSAASRPDSALETPLFELTDVSVAIPERTLLHPLTLTLPGQRVIGLIGHNGSGKSTLIKLLARQQPVSGGAIAFEGKGLSDWGERPFARPVA